MTILGETSYTGTADTIPHGNNQETGGNKLSEKQKKQITAILGVVAAVVVAAGAYLAVESGNQAAKPADKPMESEPDGGNINAGTPVITENPETNTTTVAMPGETPTEKEVPPSEVGLVIGGFNVDISQIIENVPDQNMQKDICNEIVRQCGNKMKEGEKIVRFEIEPYSYYGEDGVIIKYAYRVIKNDGTESNLTGDARIFH